MKKYLSFKFIFLLLLVGMVNDGFNQGIESLNKNNWMLEAIPPVKGLGGNGIWVLALQEFPDSSILWASTGSGVSRLNTAGDQWFTYDQRHGLGKDGVSAITIRENEIWVATYYDSMLSDTPTLYGGGLAYSSDNGQTWTYISQPRDSRLAGQNVTWDIALLDSTVWITSWGGGLRRSDDRGLTWRIVTPDSFSFDPNANLNHNSWSVTNADGVLWVGTAGGINKSLDNGLTWVNYNHQNQSQPIAGNWVRKIRHQKYPGYSAIWAVCWIASSEEEDSTEFNGLSRSDDQGYTWTSCLAGERLFDVAFDGPVVYAVGESGLFKSNDNGEHWALYPPITDEQQDFAIYSTEYFAVVVSKDGTLWVGTDDGLAKTRNDGLSWQIYRTSVRTGVNNEPRTYAYPNPFSPMRMNNIYDVGHVRIQYNTRFPTTVTIKIYDFAMDHVYTVVEGKSRPAGDYHEVWDGKNERHEQVANGVYFYKLEIANDGTFWGKIMVLD